MMLIIKYVLNIEQVSYLWLFGIYGYSFTIFVLTTAMNIIPLDWLRWSLLGFSSLVSLIVIVTEIWSAMKDEIKGPNLAKFVMLLGFLIFTYGILILSFKKYFLA
jgi:hypothetical protein